MKCRRATVDGVDCVLLEQEAVVNVGVLYANLQRFRDEEKAAASRVRETLELIAEVARVAPELLATKAP